MPGRNNHWQEKTMRKKIASGLIALSVLAGTAMSVGAQTREDEAERDFWKYEEYRNPTP
jgi:hypothetical protein